jgi:hypothetical protein
MVNNSLMDGGVTGAASAAAPEEAPLMTSLSAGACSVDAKVSFDLSTHRPQATKKSVATKSREN